MVGPRCFDVGIALQVQLVGQLAKQMGGASINDIFSVLKKCLDRDRGWVAASKKALLKATKQPDLNIDAGQGALKKAFDDARDHHHPNAGATRSAAPQASSQEPHPTRLKVHP